MYTKGHWDFLEGGKDVEYKQSSIERRWFNNDISDKLFDLIFDLKFACNLDSLSLMMFAVCVAIF